MPKKIFTQEVEGTRRRRRPRIGCPKRSLLKKWRGRDEGEDPEQDAQKDLYSRSGGDETKEKTQKGTPKKIFTQEGEGRRRRRPRIGYPKISLLKKWRGRDEGEDPGQDRKKKQKEVLSARSEKMERVIDRQEKMEGHFSTSQSPLRAVEPMEEVCADR